MIPYLLTLNNFMCYRGELPPLQLDGLHVACLSGENGAGKSALLDAITWALWGKARLPDDDLIAQGEQEMRVELWFVLGGQRYRIIRSRQRGKTTRNGRISAGKSTVDFHLWAIDTGEGRWRAIGETSINETDSLIERVLHMRYETFINASFLLQGRADEFTRKTPGDRKQVLAEILDLGDYEVLEQRARDRRKLFEDQLRALDGQIEMLAPEAAKAEYYAEQVAAAETVATSRSAALEAAQTQQQQADEHVRALHEQRKRRKELELMLRDLQAAQQGQQREMEKLRSTIAQDEAIVAREASIQVGMAELVQAQHVLAHLEGLRPRYDDLHEQRRHFQDLLKDELRKLRSEQDGLQREVARLTAALAQRPTIEQRLATAEQHLTQLEPIAHAVQRLREQRSTLDGQISQAHSLLRQHSDQRRTIEQQRHTLTTQASEQQRTIERLQRQLGDVPRWQAELTQAQAQQQQAAELSDRLTTMRARDQQTAEAVGKLQANQERLQQQAEELKQRYALLGAEATHCPLCGNGLGDAGLARVHEHYETELNDLRQQYGTALATEKARRDEIDTLRRDMKKLEKQLEQARQQAARAEGLTQQLAHATAWQAEHTTAQATLQHLQQQLEADDYATDARAALATLEQQLSALFPEQASIASDWTRALEQLEQRRADLDGQQRSLEQQLEQRPTLLSETTTCRHQLDQLTQTAAELPQVQARLATLSRTIDENNFAHDIRREGRTIEAALTELSYTPAVYDTARASVTTLEHWAAEERVLEQARHRVESNHKLLDREQTLFNHRANEITTRQQEQQQLDLALRALPGAEQQARAWAAQVQEQHHLIRVAANELYERRKRLDWAQQAAEQLAQKQASRKMLAERHGTFSELADAFGKKGVQAMLIETAIPEIEREANRLLGRITDNRMHLAFEMQRTTKKGTTSETLDITIADALGTRPYDAFSGGEAMRINFAIRVALSRLLAGRAGASLETLVIDEGFGALDAEGRERLVEAITSVQNDFKRILIITHIDELKDRFPARIEITKTPDGSRWALM
ncbi:MAG: SMC family ATPase [Chloroflexaceae bacterium]|nr:SMC family ATPase [Chloroflexaceae bacterium]